MSLQTHRFAKVIQMLPNRAYQNNNISFIDLIQNTLIGFIMLFIIAFMMIKPIDERPPMEKHAQFIITVTWDSKTNDDVDTWLQSPEGTIIYFKNQKTDVAHLDRDDIGIVRDTIEHSDGTKEIIYINQEILTIRGIIAGEWVLNVHMYSKRDPGPANVVVTIDKITPYRRVLRKQVKMKDRGDEITIARFTMDRKGNIFKIDDVYKSLVIFETTSTYNTGDGE